MADFIEHDNIKCGTCTHCNDTIYDGDDCAEYYDNKFHYECLHEYIDKEARRYTASWADKQAADRDILDDIYCDELKDSDVA